MRKYDSIVAGCGFAGAVIARELAEKGKKVLILEQREHVGGNCYDLTDDYGILIHKYGPHIFHTNNKEVFEYLSRFTDWYSYEHEVCGNINGSMIPIPFNLNSLSMIYGEERGNTIRQELIQTYGKNSRVPILELRSNPSPDIRELAEYVYENVFLKYTMKQWGQKPEEVDTSVTGRVPVLLSEDNRYFQDEYQCMPRKGFTKLFNRLLDHENIEIRYNTKAQEHLRVMPGEDVKFDGERFTGDIIYTGPIDELFSHSFGRLPYRSLRFCFEHRDEEYFQNHSVVNYTVSEDYTRITEFKHYTGEKIREVPERERREKGTTILKEYPIPYSGKDGEVPCYAVFNDENFALHRKYAQLLEQIPKFHLLGRLAEYKYYNMDAIVEKAIMLAEKIN